MAAIPGSLLKLIHNNPYWGEEGGRRKGGSAEPYIPHLPPLHPLYMSLNNYVILLKTTGETSTTCAALATGAISAIDEMSATGETSATSGTVATTGN